MTTTEPRSGAKPSKGGTPPPPVIKPLPKPKTGGKAKPKSELTTP